MSVSKPILDTPKHYSWAEAELRRAYPDFFTDELVDTAETFIKRRRVGDFSIERGKVSARTNIDNEPERINLLIAKPDSAVFEKLFSELADSSYFFAQFLAGAFPKGVGAVFTDCGMELSQENTEIRVNGETGVTPRLRLRQCC